VIEIRSAIWFYYSGAWHLCPDVLQDPAPVWEFGLPGNGPMDLVADTGILSFALDNSSSNAAGLAGYYSTGHPDCPAWFVDGLPVKVICTRQDTFVSATRFLGVMTDARPTSGVFEEAIVEVECHDWMDYASIQKLGQLAIQTSKRADEALTTALLDFPIQPAAVDFDEGKETWPKIFDTDDSMKMTMAALFQKLARNEGGGYIFLEGDGTLRFDNRHARPATATAAFTLDATGATPMNELDVSWSRKEIKNRVEANINLGRTDTTATTVIWKLQKTFALSAGQELILTCPYRDPATGARISATEVVDPLVGGTHIKFGSVDDGSSNDLIGSLIFPLDVGGNTTEITLTNTGTVSGYVNFIELIGKGIYTYEPMMLEAEDAASIAARGELLLPVKLEQIVNPNTAHAYAVSLKQQLANPAREIEGVRFLANFSDEFMTAAMTAEVNIRFAVVEGQTGTDIELFACRLKFEQEGPLLWVEIIPAPAATVNYFIWDQAPGATYGWDAGRWAF